VAVVVFVFLGRFRMTLIPLVAVPVSIIGTFAVMLLVGYSDNGLPAGARAGNRQRDSRAIRLNQEKRSSSGGSKLATSLNF
jgi:hypothetical protein